MELLKKLFNTAPKVDYKQMVENDAQIIDVRTKEEFQRGHIPGSVNIPLQVLGNNLSGIPKDEPLILCCASGMRSGSAASMLKSKGFTNVHNGGAWTSLQNKIR